MGRMDGPSMGHTVWEIWLRAPVASLSKNISAGTRELMILG